MSGRDALREVLTGAVLRAAAGVRDAGEAFLARVESADGGDHLDTQGGADIWVHVVDVLTEMPLVGRLFVPGNVLFAVADMEAGDSVTVVRPRDADGPGVPYVLHGDAGAQDRVPSWLRSAVGIFTRKLLRLESAASRVVILAHGGEDDVQLNLTEGGKRVARVSDRVTIGTVTGQAGPYPVQFVFTPTNADGTPGAPTTLGPTLTLTAYVLDQAGNGAPHVVA